MTIAASINELRNKKNAILFRKYINNIDEEIRDLPSRKKIKAFAIFVKRY